MLDLMNVTIGPFLDDLMPQVLARVAEVTRSADDVARIGDDQVAICLSADEPDLPGLCARLEETLVTSAFRVGERTFALHGVATYATSAEVADGDLLREALARNAGETMLRIRRIFQGGLLTGGHGGGEQTTQLGFARLATSSAVELFGAVGAELCFDEQRVVAGELPDRPADHEWTIVVDGRSYGTYRTWQRTAVTLPAVFVAAVGAYMNETFERLLALEHSRRDPLTGLLNRRGIAVAVAERPPTSVAMVDVDHFKALNTRMGTDAGDEA
ncbi:MAG: diguanylate cyclase domain-containing protein, partial [Actinomycetota bacterium]